MAPSLITNPYADNQHDAPPELVVPVEDNPLAGWRGIGLRLLSDQIWPSEILHNPLMAYLTGRRRGRLLEDLLGSALWVVVAFTDILCFGLAIKSGDPLVFIPIGCAQLVILPSLVGIWSELMVALHIRRTIGTVPFEELVVTRMTSSEIAHGLAVRPLALQSTLIVAEASLHVTLALLTLTNSVVTTSAGRGAIMVIIVIYAVIGGTYRWYLCARANEIAASYALRAHLYLKKISTANARMFLDWVRVPVVTLLILSPLLIDRHMVILSGLLILILSPLNLLSQKAEEVMDWVSRFDQHWWVRTGGVGLESETLAVTMLGSWRPSLRRKIVAAEQPVE